VHDAFLLLALFLFNSCVNFHVRNATGGIIVFLHMIHPGFSGYCIVISVLYCYVQYRPRH